LYNRGGVLSISIDGSCIPTNFPKVQVLFNNSLEITPILNVVGSSAARAFRFSALLCSLPCTRLLTSTVQYSCDSSDLLWWSHWTKKCVHRQWQMLFG